MACQCSQSEQKLLSKKILKVSAITKRPEVKVIYNITLLPDPNKPKTISKALNGVERQEWKESALIKYNNFLVSESWEFVACRKAKKEKKTIVGSQWIFKKEVEPSGNIQYKLRIVSKGLMQLLGVNYTEKFAPGVNNATTRIILALIL